MEGTSSGIVVSTEVYGELMEMLSERRQLPRAQVVQVSADQVAEAKSWLSSFGGHSVIYQWSAKLIREAQYQGLDVYRILAVMKARSNLEYDQVMEDICKCVIVVAMRGTRFKNLKGKSTPEFVKVIEDLISRYNIKENGSGCETITFARIVATVPQFNVQAQIMGIARVPVAASQDKTTDCSRWLMAKDLPAILPRVANWEDEEQYNTTVKASKAVAAMIDATLNANRQINRVPYKFEKTRIDQYWTILHNSTVLNEAQRVKWVGTLCIMKPGSTDAKRKLIAPWIVKPYADLWDRMPEQCSTADIRAMIPEDPEREEFPSDSQSKLNRIKNSLIPEPEGQVQRRQPQDTSTEGDKSGTTTG
jgi:hypothetical protein